MYSIVVAMARNRVIGAKDRIPWRLRSDLVRLKNLTKDQIVIVGKNTFESMAWYYEQSGRNMPGKVYIVITHDQKYRLAEQASHKALITHSLEDALKRARQLTKDEIFIIGGAHIYQQTLPFASKLYITEVDAEVAGDVVFPAIQAADWHEVSRDTHQADEKNEFAYSFVTLERQDR